MMLRIITRDAGELQPDMPPIRLQSLSPGWDTQQDRIHWVILRKAGKKPTLSSSLLVIEQDEILERLQPGLSHLEACRYLDKWLAIAELCEPIVPAATP
jgi:hypothetical protein